MIKAIMFDLGGVILDMKPILEKFVKIFNPEDKEKFWEYLNIEAIPLCRGDISEYDFWKKVAGKFNKDLPDDKLANLWTDDFEKLTIVNEDMMKLLHDLKRNYKLAAVSNSIEAHGLSHKKRGMLEPFDVVLFSHELGMTKENDRIFSEAIKRLGVMPGECIFIDDVRQFVDTAESFGIKGLLFKDYKELIVDFKKNGVKV